MCVARPSSAWTSGCRPETGPPTTAFKRWLHQLWLDLGSARFWKGCAHHFLRMVYDLAAGGLALVLLAFAFLAPAAAIAVSRSDDDAGLSFIPPALAWPLAVVALVAAVAIVVFAPILDAKIDLWLLSPSPAAMLQDEVNALADARLGAVSSAHTERRRIERDLHDSVQPRLVSLAMTIGLAQTKFDTDPSAAKALMAEAHEDAKTALVELRNVVRGIAPTILSDRGLDAALSSVVQRAACPDDAGHRPAGARSRGDRIGRVLRRRRGAHQHRQARTGVAGRRDGPTRSGRQHAPRRRCSTTAAAVRRSPTARPPPACVVWPSGCAPPVARSRFPARSPGPRLSPRCCHAHSDRRGLGAAARGH